MALATSSFIVGCNSGTPLQDSVSNTGTAPLKAGVGPEAGLAQQNSRSNSDLVKVNDDNLKTIRCQDKRIGTMFWSGGKLYYVVGDSGIDSIQLAIFGKIKNDKWKLCTSYITDMGSILTNRSDLLASIPADIQRYRQI